MSLIYFTYAVYLTPPYLLYALRVSIGDHPHLLLAGFLDRAPQRRLSGTSVG